ncbi:hypothetical protein EDC04DRAFT_2895432 [Pisolithus marmoratus]|nr:hypothetical protein EDC04DRAFT_2895432 [Pisolithus marmoratus]
MASMTHSEYFLKKLPILQAYWSTTWSSPTMASVSFRPVTPHSLRIWTEGELEACDKSTYDYMRTRRLQPSHSPAPEVDASEEEMLSDDHSHSELLTTVTLTSMLRRPKAEDRKRIPYPQLKIDGEKQSPDAEIGAC